jgi:hypothetical protein
MWRIPASMLSACLCLAGYGGAGETNGDQFNAEARAFKSAAGAEFPNGAVAADMTLDGTVTERSSMSGD